MKKLNINFRGFKLKEEIGSKAKVILVDQDAVLADFEGEFLRRWKEKYSDLTFIPKRDRDTFYIADDYPQDMRDKVTSILYAKGFIASLPPIPGSLDALREMSEAGHLVRICTSALYGHYDSVKEKHDWVEKHLGIDWVRRLIISPDKTMVVGDYLIDDKPIIFGIMEPTWEQIIFDAPYNRDITDKKRLNNLKDWRGVIEGK